MKVNKVKTSGGEAGLPPEVSQDSVTFVSVTNLVKRYGGIVALDNLSLKVKGGTIHAVVGENGAGKSTLMKILAGVVQPDSGQLTIEGQEITLSSPQMARNHGIGIVYQELSLFPHRSVLANLFINREPISFGFISSRQMARRAAPWLEKLGLELDLKQPVGRLPLGERQLIELCRVLLEEPRLLILDEPNSALNESETNRLFSILRRLREHGITIIYVSHRLEEVFAICDQITVIRNGQNVLAGNINNLTVPTVIEAMIGKRQNELFPSAVATKTSASAKQLVVDQLNVGTSLNNISFQVSAGEIVGLAGLEGAGISNLLRVLFGDQPATSGLVTYPDDEKLPKSATGAAGRGICLIPADRRHQGLMLNKSVEDNLAHVSIGALGQGRPWLNRQLLRAAAYRQINDLHIHPPLSRVRASQLSGGNQQKVVIGKWLEISPQVILLDDPTRGVDVGAKQEIYALIQRLAADGRIVLFHSTEAPELVGMCDRILVFYRGQLVGQIRGRDGDDQRLLHAMNTGEIEGAESDNPAH